MIYFTEFKIAKMMYKLLLFLGFLNILSVTATGIKKDIKITFDFDDPRVLCYGNKKYLHKNCPTETPQFVCKGTIDESSKKQLYTWICEPHNPPHQIYYQSKVITTGLYIYDEYEKLERIANPRYNLKIRSVATPMANLVDIVVYGMMCILVVFISVSFLKTNYSVMNLEEVLLKDAVVSARKQRDEQTASRLKLRNWLVEMHEFQQRTKEREGENNSNIFWISGKLWDNIHEIVDNL